MRFTTLRFAHISEFYEELWRNKEDSVPNSVPTLSSVLMSVTLACHRFLTGLDSGRSRDGVRDIARYNECVRLHLNNEFRK